MQGQVDEVAMVVAFIANSTASNQVSIIPLIVQRLH
jgi:hypothetical protein